VRWIHCSDGASPAHQAAHAEPRRDRQSLDYCADQFVLALADRAQIAALSIGSQGATTRTSAVAQRDMRQTRGHARRSARAPSLISSSAAWGGPWDAEQVYARDSTCRCCK
jgi:iron complex transport system substrate-binding protein